MTSIHITIEFDVLEKNYKKYDETIGTILKQINEVSDKITIKEE